MQGEVFDSGRIRRSTWDGPFAMSCTMQNTTSNVVLSSTQTLPYALFYNPGTTPITVQMYVPSPANLVWCHEIVNMGTGAGVITIKGASTGNPSLSPTIAGGKRGEVVWNPFQATPDWNVFASA